MITQILRDPWRAVWRAATADGTLAIALLVLAVGLVLATLLPQRPLGDPVAYARWLSATQAHLGRATPTLQTLGLFTVTRSFGFRALLAFTAACLLLRLIEIGGLLREGWKWAALSRVLAHAGALGLLAGLLITRLWGWQTTGVIVLEGERSPLPGGEGWVALDQDTLRLSHSTGLMTFVEARGPVVHARVTDSAGHTLLLQQTVESEPVEEVRVALTEDRYFAVPDARLVVRLTLPHGHDEAYSPVLVQVYHSPPGELVTEAVAEGDTRIAVDEVTLYLTHASYAKVTATFNPGLWPAIIGVVLLSIGVLGDVAFAAWPWLRARTEGIAPPEGMEA